MKKGVRLTAGALFFRGKGSEKVRHAENFLLGIHAEIPCKDITE